MFFLWSHGFSMCSLQISVLFVSMRVEISLFSSGMLGCCGVFLLVQFLCLILLRMSCGHSPRHLFHHMSIPSQSATSNDSCDRLNSNQPSQFFTCPSVFHGNVLPSFRFKFIEIAISRYQRVQYDNINNIFIIKTYGFVKKSYNYI